ncbi:TPA: glycosyltransferase, partial [Enterococcus faecium]|nr:glycosyltransferase [Enterococcus faecium]
MLLSLYDKEKPEYLKEALTSIFEQTVMPKEIVLVYDGPINEKLQVVVTYFQQKDPHLFTVVKLEKNQGLGIALAIGLEHTKNRLVARMDTDDIMEPQRLEKQLEIFQK